MDDVWKQVEDGNEKYRLEVVEEITNRLYKASFEKIMIIKEILDL